MVSLSVLESKLPLKSNAAIDSHKMHACRFTMIFSETPNMSNLSWVADPQNPKNVVIKARPSAASAAISHPHFRYRFALQAVLSPTVLSRRVLPDRACRTRGRDRFYDLLLTTPLVRRKSKATNEHLSQHSLSSRKFFSLEMYSSHTSPFFFSRAWINFDFTCKFSMTCVRILYSQG